MNNSDAHVSTLKGRVEITITKKIEYKTSSLIVPNNFNKNRKFFSLNDCGSNFWSYIWLTSFN
ncbi:hypothetical protein KCTC52924_00387 [Arenibacter antarcticus]